jgi:hypothetical protein
MSLSIPMASSTAPITMAGSTSWNTADDFPQPW